MGDLSTQIGTPPEISRTASGCAAELNAAEF
jgi:hypothetical protein